MLAYWAAQMLGAIIGAVLTASFTNLWSCSDYGLTFSTASGGHPYYGDGQVFGFEFFATFVLVSVVHMTAVSKPGAGVAAPFAIGLAIAATCGSDGAYTGGFANPARFLGPVS